MGGRVMLTRCQAVGSLSGLLAALVGCAPLNHTSRLPGTSAAAAYTLPVRNARSTEFAELQQFTARDADNKERKLAAENTNSTGIKLASGDAGLPPLTEKPSHDWLTLAEAADERNSGEPTKPATPSVTPIFENGERLPAPRSAPPPRDLPTVEGQRLRLGPGESAAERAVLLAQMLDAAQAESRSLRDRLRALELQVQEADRAREEERQSAAKAAADAVRYRLRMEALDEEVAALRERLRRAELQDVETLREIISALERLLHDEPPANAKNPSH